MGAFIEGRREFVEAGEDLPTLPNAVLELHAALEHEDMGDEDIAAILERDPALAAKLLRVANSAFYASRAEPVGTVLGAVRRVGVRQVRSTCLVLSVVKAFSGRSGGLDHQELWRHSVAVGLTAQMLWKRGGGAGAGGAISADDVYVAGLLHDVGLLVLEQFFPDAFRETMEIQELSGDPLWKSEEASRWRGRAISTCSMPQPRSGWVTTTSRWSSANWLALENRPGRFWTPPSPRKLIGNPVYGPDPVCFGVAARAPTID